MIEKESPNFTVRMWLGEKYSGEIKVEGRTLVTKELCLSMKDLINKDGSPKGSIFFPFIF